MATKKDSGSGSSKPHDGPTKAPDKPRPRLPPEVIPSKDRRPRPEDGGVRGDENKSFDGIREFGKLPPKR